MSADRNFATNPRTLRESFVIIAAAAKRGRLTHGTISNDEGNYCAIGSLLTPKQRKWLRDNGYEDNDSDELAKVIGKKNLKAMTGMSLDQIYSMMLVNDDFYRSYLSQRTVDGVESPLSVVLEGLKNGKVTIRYVKFKLGEK